MAKCCHAGGGVHPIIYGSVFTVASRKGRENPTEAILRVLSEALESSYGRDIESLVRDQPASLPTSAYSGFVWEADYHEGAWTGELLWRTPHPVASGTPLTTHVILEETRFFTRISVRVTADRGLSAMGPSTIGQAHPSFLPFLARDTDLYFESLGVGPRPLQRVGIVDFVESILLSDTRRTPVVVVSPLEEGGHAVPVETLADEFLGLAHLYYIGEHSDSFVLSDAIGDRRLSCYWGAMRIYMPGFCRSDDPFDHPLLVRDGVSDPVLRAGRLGVLGRKGVERFRMPERVGVRRAARETPIKTPAPSVPDALRTDSGAEARPAAAPGAREGDGAADHVPERGAADSTPAEAPSPGVSDAEGERVVVGDPLELPASHPDDESARRSASGLPVPSEVLELPGRIGALADALRELVDGQRRVAEEITRLRTITAVRSANTTSLERRVARLEDLLSRHFEPAPTEPEGAAFPVSPDRGDPEDDDAATLLSVVRGAQERYPQTLLFLDAAMEAAADSPYDDPEQVGVILDAMDLVATRRAAGSLGMSVNDAFRDLGIDYRGHISRGTPERLRKQYFFYGPDGREYDCVEHIVLGTSYDPKHCLRIYFTSRAPQETRLVIGHVGRHFEVKTTT